MYLLALEELRTAAAQRHVMLRAEFDALDSGAGAEHFRDVGASAERWA